MKITAMMRCYVSLQNRGETTCKIQQNVEDGNNGVCVSLQTFSNTCTVLCRRLLRSGSEHDLLTRSAGQLL